LAILKNTDVPSALIGHDDLLVVQGGVGGQQEQPLFGAPVPDEYDLCRHRDALVVFADLDHDRGENLCAVSSLADLPVDGRQMKIFPLVAIEDLFRDLEHAEGMHPLREQLLHGCGKGKPAVEQKVTGLNPACNGLGRHLDYVGGASQRLKLLADHPGTQQQQESPPIGMDRVEKPIYRVLGHAAASTRFEGAVQVLSGKDQGEQNPEHGDRKNALLFVDVASLQQAANFLIEKELVNLVFTGNDV